MITLNIPVLITSLVGTLTLLGLIWKIVSYFSSLKSDVTGIRIDISDLKRQQKLQWLKIDENKEMIQAEREKLIKVQSDLEHNKETVKDIRSTNRFKLSQQIEEENG